MVRTRSVWKLSPDKTERARDVFGRWGDAMKISTTELPDLLVIEQPVYRDDRGYFFEAWHRERCHASGLPREFVQDNVSHSTRGVLRGLHYQEPNGQGKLVMPLRGEIFDVAVDIRVGSPTFGRWFGMTLTAEMGSFLYIPPGFAHGFSVTGDEALVLYKCTRPYDQAAEGSVLWSDPDLGILWPQRSPVLSPKDCRAPRLAEIPRDRLPLYGGEDR